MNESNNPFPVSGYRGQAYFCDREIEIETLHDHLINERNVLLFGWRRLGKTALLQRFFELLEQTGWETLYIDLLMTRSGAGALNVIADSILRTFGSVGGGLSPGLVKLLSRIGAQITFNAQTGQPKVSMGLRPDVPVRSTLETLGDYLTSLDKKIVIALDEFQRVSEYEDLDGEAWFRSRAQSYPNIRFIYCGSHRGVLESMFLEKNRSFYRSTQNISLEPIEREVYTRFISAQFAKGSVAVADAVAMAIYDWAQGQTYAVQLQCNKLYGAGVHPAVEAVNQIQREILDQEKSVFQQVVRLLTDNQWNLLKAIALSGGVRSVYESSFLRENGLGSQASVQTALKKLLEQEIVVRDRENYRVHDVLFARWIQNL